MLVYLSEKESFMSEVENDSIVERIEKNLFSALNRHTGESEKRSWLNSLQHMYTVLNDSDIPLTSGIAIEYNIPLTSKRIDFMISGYGSASTAQTVIIELKQWDFVENIEGSLKDIKTILGGSKVEVAHPSYQALSYAALLKDYNSSVEEEEITLHPCCFLHNYRKKENDPLTLSKFSPLLKEAPPFTYGEVLKLREFIKTYIKKGDRKKILYTLEEGKIRPSKTLQDSISSMLKGNEEFTMIDEQVVAFDNITRHALSSYKDGKKRTIIVKGGPGTGKSVIAINALSFLTGKGLVAQYVSKNSAPRTVYAEKLSKNYTKYSIDNLFKSSSKYAYSEENSIDVILSDESHRLTDKSGLFRNIGESQTKEIINASLCSVFFIDERQRVTLEDKGSVDEIRKWAEKLNSRLIETELSSQFRCNGSDGFLAFLDDVLEIRESANKSLKGLNYKVEVCESASDMRKIIEEKNKEKNSARIVAGYCWEWEKSEINNTSYHDIKIGDFEISWNLKNGTPFAISDTSVNEAGCIHTVQGLEFDYIGVIIGPDMRYENGHIVTDFTKRAKTDRSLKGIAKIYKEDKEKALKIADEIIKNTYRTLMTRGMKGLYIYATDKALAAYLRARCEL